MGTSQHNKGCFLESTSSIRLTSCSVSHDTFRINQYIAYLYAKITLHEGHLSLSFSLLVHIILPLSLINYFVPKLNYTLHVCGTQLLAATTFKEATVHGYLFIRCQVTTSQIIQFYDLQTLIIQQAVTFKLHSAAKNPLKK